MYKPSYRSKKAKRVFESVRTELGFSAGQSDIWDEVACMQTKFGVKSRTHDMSDVYEKQKVNLEAYIKALSVEENQAGFTAVINGRIIGLEALSQP